MPDDHRDAILDLTKGASLEQTADRYVKPYFETAGDGRDLFRRVFLRNLAANPLRFAFEIPVLKRNGWMADDDDAHIAEALLAGGPNDPKAPAIAEGYAKEGEAGSAIDLCRRAMAAAKDDPLAFPPREFRKVAAALVKVEAFGEAFSLLVEAADFSQRRLLTEDAYLLEGAAAYHARLLARDGGSLAGVHLSAQAREALGGSPSPYRFLNAARGFYGYGEFLHKAGEDGKATLCIQLAHLAGEIHRRAEGGQPPPSVNPAFDARSLLAAWSGGIGDADPIIGFGSEWRFSAGHQRPPGGWTQPEFAAADWESGAAPIGYGDDDLRTKFAKSKGGRSVLHLFAVRDFEIADPAAAGPLLAAVIRDDGLVLYLNGMEVARENIPDLPLVGETHALWAIGGDMERVPVLVPLPADLLKPGKNRLAAEVHQFDENSTDLAFDLSLLKNATDPMAGAAELTDEALSAGLGEAWTKVPEALRKEILASPIR
ncbi:MAG: hypothetical protein R3F11_29235 [Verrucomicrobiales bacterium]